MAPCCVFSASPYPFSTASSLDDTYCPPQHGSTGTKQETSAGQRHTRLNHIPRGAAGSIQTQASGVMGAPLHPSASSSNPAVGEMTSLPCPPMEVSPQPPSARRKGGPSPCKSGRDRCETWVPLVRSGRSLYTSPSH